MLIFPFGAIITTFIYHFILLSIFSPGICLYTAVSILLQINTWNWIPNILAKVKFVTKITKMGDKRIIIVPKDFHIAVKKFGRKQVRVVIDDEI